MFKPKRVKQVTAPSKPNLVCIGGKWFEQTPVKVEPAPVVEDKKTEDKPVKEVKVKPLSPAVSTGAMCGGWLLAGVSWAVFIIYLVLHL